MKRDANRNLFTDILIGAAAGAAATWVMDQVTTVMYEREPEAAKERENAARGDKTAYEIAAEKAGGIAGRELTEDQRKKLGSAIHWSLGVSAGALYGLLRNRVPSVGIGSGVAFGVVFWLAMDEAALTLLGLTPPPDEFPWQTHARGLVGHVVFGVVTESMFDAADLAGEFM